MQTKRSADQATTAPSDAIDFSLLEVLRSLWKWRKFIIYTTAIAFVGTIVISLFLSNYYMASTRFLAVNPDQANPDVIAGAVSSKTSLYGNMNDLDRLMSIAESNELVEFLVDEYDLLSHYEINPNDPKAKAKVQLKFRGLYEVTKTDRDAILIEVEDKDPVFAAKLANAARNKVDAISRELIRNAMERSVALLRMDVEKKKSEYDLASDSLMSLRSSYNLYGMNNQLEEMTLKSNEINQGLVDITAKIQAYKESDVRGRRDSIAKLTVFKAGMEQVKLQLDSQLVNVGKGIGPTTEMFELRGSFGRALNMATHRLELFESALKTDPSLIAVLEEATVPVIKSRPKRSIIVIGAAILAFALSLFAALAIENARQFNWKKITE